MHAKYTSNVDMAGLSAQEREIMSEFVASECSSVTADVLLASHPMSRDAANQILRRLHRKGWLRRIKRGRYILVPLGSSSPEPVVQDPWPLAMDLFLPGFISGWSAAQHWDLTEQIFEAVAVVTGRVQRSNEQTVGGITFRTRTLPENKLFGSKKIWSGSQRVEVADPHRLLIDILDDPSFGGGARHTLDVVAGYWKSKHADPSVLLDYAHRFGRGTVFKRLGFTAELYGNVDPKWLKKCSDGMSAGISKLDPAGRERGKIASRWRLRVNMPVTES